MTELMIKRIDSKLVVNNVADNLNKVSNLYGYKIPGPMEAAALTKFVIDNFGQIKPSEIVKAFELVALGKINVNIEAYGRILIIPILTEVLKSYRKHCVIDNQKRLAEPKKDNTIKNKNALLLCLYDFRDPEKKITSLHYKVIDEYIEPFKVEDKKRAYQEAKVKVRAKATEKMPINQKGRIEMQDAIDKVDILATVEAKIILVGEWLEVNRENIDYDLTRQRIINK